MITHLNQFLCLIATIVVRLNHLSIILHHFGKNKENKNLMIIFILKIQIRNNKIKLLMFHKNKLIHQNKIKRKLIYHLIIVPRSYLFIQVYLHYLEVYC